MKFGRLERGTGPQPMSEINMTPLIDVMLVLLVIFMIAAPLMASGLRLDLPQTDAGQPDRGSASIRVAIDAEGRFHLDDQRLEATALTARLEAAGRADPLAEVQLRADRRVPYGRVAELIGMVQKAGLSRIGFVTETPAPGAR